ncbi:MAG: hypothetical protein ABI333_11090 [bacterium]
MQRTTFMSLILLLLGLTGCNTFAVKTPENFVSLERVRTRTYYKAVSPDNAVITVTAFEHRDRGSLAFWSAILEREMTLQRGYKLTAAEPVKNDLGLQGRQLAFTARSGTTPYTYVATLFVTRSYLYVVESAAKSKRYPSHRRAVDELVSSFRPR